MVKDNILIGIDIRPTGNEKSYDVNEQYVNDILYDTSLKYPELFFSKMTEKKYKQLKEKKLSEKKKLQGNHCRSYYFLSFIIISNFSDFLRQSCPLALPVGRRVYVFITPYQPNRPQIHLHNIHINDYNMLLRNIYSNPPFQIHCRHL